jgi:hypothetical protein
MSEKPVSAFEKAAAEGSGNAVSEVWGFLAANRKWWLLPIIIVFLAAGVFAVVAGSPMAPFIYTLF